MKFNFFYFVNLNQYISFKLFFATSRDYTYIHRI